MSYQFQTWLLVPARQILSFSSRLKIKILVLNNFRLWLKYHCVIKSLKPHAITITTIAPYPSGHKTGTTTSMHSEADWNIQASFKKKEKICPALAKKRGKNKKTLATHDSNIYSWLYMQCPTDKQTKIDYIIDAHLWRISRPKLSAIYLEKQLRNLN